MSLSQNLQTLRRAAGDAQVMAILKANAYGLGLERVMACVKAADGIGVLDIVEAEQLRALGHRGPILLLEGVFEARDLETCSRRDIWHTIHHSEQLEWLARHKSKHRHTVFLKLNSGMNRLGFKPNAYRSAWQRLQGLSQVEQTIHMTHYANADVAQGCDEAFAIFQATVSDLTGITSTCNSAALLRQQGQSTRLGDWVRPGIALYGASPDYPDHTAANWGLQPALSLRSAVIALQHLKAGESVGYGSVYTAPHSTTLATVACGYADGYPRHATLNTPVLVNGQRCRLAGRVSMDMLSVDVGHLQDIQVGSEVTLWGQSSQGATLCVEEVARSAGTSAYELLTALAARVPVVQAA